MASFRAFRRERAHVLHAGYDLGGNSRVGWTMFWKVSGFSLTSPIDSILDKEHYTLEELLIEDDLIQECRSLNGRLINFLGSKENVEAMLQHMLRPMVSEKQGDENVKRLAWQSCEIFCCEVDPIFSVLLDNEETLKMFLSVLEAKEPLDSTTAGYFGRVMSHLLLRRPAPLAQFLAEHKEWIVRLIDHLADTSITDVVIRLMGADEQTNAQLPTSYIHWISETDALRRIMDRLSGEESARVQNNAAVVLMAVIRSQPSPLSRELAESGNLDHLLSFVISSEGDLSVPVLQVIIASLDPRRHLITSLLPSPSASSYEDIMENSLFQSLAQKLISFLPMFAEKLAVSTSSREQKTPFGLLVPPLGHARLKILEVVAILMGMKSESLIKTLMTSRLLESCMELFVSYPFHNLLHRNVVSIFTSAMNYLDQPLLESLFEKLELCKWIMEMPQSITSTKTTYFTPHEAPMRVNGCAMDDKSEGKMQRTLRAGYLGHVLQLANQILQVADSSPYLDEYLNSHCDWQKYLSTVVHPTNEREDLSSWKCGRPQEMLHTDCFDGQGDTDVPSSSNGALYRADFEEEEEEEGNEENTGMTWRPMDVLTSEGGEITATAAMLTRLGLRETTSRMVKEMSDSSSSSSSSSSASSSSASSNSSGDGDEEEESMIMVSPQTLMQNLAKEYSSGSGREEAEKEASTSDSVGEEPPPSNPFNSFSYWKIDFSDVELPSE